MNTKENIFKRWWKLCQPSKKYLFVQIITYTCYTLFLSLLTIFAARTINCMYAGDWSGAFLNLGLELLTIVIRNFFMHLEYIYYGKQLSCIRTNVAKKVYNKILSCKRSEFDAVSKEKVTNIALNNMSHLSDFPDYIANFIAYSFQVVFTLVTVFVSNALAGVIIACLGVVNFFAYFILNKKMGKCMLERYEKKDDMFKSYSKVINGKSVINELQGKQKYEKELLTDVENFNKAYSKYYLLQSYKNNVWYAVWNVVVYAVAALMLFFVTNNTLDISIYLIIVPYLSTCTDKLNSLFDKTNNIENMRVDVDRVNLILNLNDQELVQYGKFNKKTDGYALGLVDVSCYKKYGHEFEIKDVNINFENNAINVVKSARGGGKREIFNLLRRYTKPDEGKVLLDNLDLYAYNSKTFKSHINYCSSHPTFIEGSIKENFLIVNKDFNKIKEVCGKLGILKTIEKLPNGFETKIYDIKSSQMHFMFGLVRALISDCKILMIYEIPSDAPETFRQKLVGFLKKFKIDKTVIMFTHTDDYDELASKVYLVKNGAVTKEK